MTDLDLAMDAFMDHPVGTRGAHITVPHENRVRGFNGHELMLVAGQTGGGNRHRGWGEVDRVNLSAVLSLYVVGSIWTWIAS